jgi:nucleoside phosphorylase
VILDARRAARVSPPPIYLHFLDRELGDAFEFALDLPTAERALATLALGTMSQLVCSLSALTENEGLHGGEGMVSDLTTVGALIPRSTHPTFAEFLESRWTLYEHDKPRYPMYFDAAPLGTFGEIRLHYAPGSTTESLHERLELWTEGESTISDPNRDLPRDVREGMLRRVASELARREGRAVTYAMFGLVAGEEPEHKVLERIVRRRISLEYTDHHRGEHAQLATGVSLALEPLERVLATDWPFERDIPICSVLLAAAGLAQLANGWERRLWQPVLALRGGVEHFGVVSRIQRIARALDAAIPRTHVRAERRRPAIDLVRSSTPERIGTRPMDASTLLLQAQSALDGLARSLGKRGLGPELVMFDDVLVPLTADVLLIVATDVEERETLREFGFPPGKSPRRHPHGQQIYLELGSFTGQDVFLVRSEMGAGGAGGSQFTADDAIRDLTPSWVLMLGIAFGVDPSKQRIGDVLVADEIILYDHQRIGTSSSGEREVIYRDPPGQPDAALLKRLRDGSRDFVDANVWVGRLLSGSDLVDNEEHRDELVRHAANGEAIAGEMELYGLFAASERQRGRWGAAKAICDFGDGRKFVDKPARQALAAKNAARFVRHAIDQGLLDSPP